MLYVLMTICGQRYGIRGASVIEVVPAINLMPAAQGNASVICGEFNYHGKKVLVVDGGLLLTGQVSHRSLSTRIVILNVENDKHHTLIGLMAEEMTETVMYIEKLDALISEGNNEDSIEVAQDQAITRGFGILSVRHICRMALSC